MMSLAWGASARRARTVVALVVAVVVGFAMLALVAAPAEAACSDPVDVQVDQDACASTLAVSVTGDASGQGCTAEVSCISVSGTGNAQNSGGGWSCAAQSHVSVSCIAVSGAGNASNAAGMASCGRQDGVQVACVALSAGGTASNSAGDFSCGVGIGVHASCLAVGGAGASNSAGGTFQSTCGSGYFAINVGCVAISGTGDASNSAGPSFSCGQGAGAIAIGCIAVSGTGNATNTVSNGGCAAAGPVSIAVGCIAASASGSADNNVTGNCGVGSDPNPAGLVSWAGSNPPYDPFDLIFWALGGPGNLPGAAIGCVEVDDQGPRMGIGGSHGCVATAGSSCSFRGNAAGIPNGVASATSGSWAVTHEVGGVTVTDVSGTGPNAFPFMFADGVLYALTVGADGVGVVAAGSPT